MGAAGSRIEAAAMASGLLKTSANFTAAMAERRFDWNQYVGACITAAAGNQYAHYWEARLSLVLPLLLLPLLP